MILSELIRGLDIDGPGAAATHIRDITDDSRRATPGCLFIARAGARDDGRRFVADAVSRGAAAVLVEGDARGCLPAGATALCLTTARIDGALVGELAERFFGRPSRKLKLIGVTGTNGKTTITFVIQHLLRRAGVKTGIIGTVVIDDGDTRRPADLTTPGAIDFSRALAAMVDRGCQAAVAEVSSHALHQGRTAALDFDVAIFTNLTGDHLDYHHTMEEYAAAKAVLFERLRPDAWAVVNADDAWAGRMVRNCPARVIPCHVIEPARSHAPGRFTDGCGLSNHASRPCRAEVVSLASDHSRVRFEGQWGSFEVRLPLVGRHNVINVLEAVAAANCVAALSRTLRGSLETCPAPPGRLERVLLGEAEAAEARLPVVLVDYAHTHDALENVLTALRPVTPGRLIVVFGCGGDRDRTKRPKMAAVCCRIADRVVITSDNPRTEEPGFIIGQIMSGVPEALRPAGAAAIEVEGVGPEDLGRADGRAPVSAAAVSVEPDRAAAIAQAVAEAGPDDVVLIAGKGHEDYQIIGTTKRHFDDREQAAAALRGRLAARQVVVSV